MWNVEHVEFEKGSDDVGPTTVSLSTVCMHAYHEQRQNESFKMKIQEFHNIPSSRS